MKRVITLSFIWLFCFSLQIKAQSVTDSLENSVINYLKTSKDPLFKATLFYAKFYETPSKYIVYIKRCDRPCRKSISKLGIYKIASIDEKKNVYFANTFMKNIDFPEEVSHFFLDDTECTLLEEKSYLSIELSEMIMLLIDNKFSITKEFKGTNIYSLLEDLLCPTAPGSISRAKVRKKYGHL